MHRLMESDELRMVWTKSAVLEAVVHSSACRKAETLENNVSVPASRSSLKRPFQDIFVPPPPSHCVPGICGSIWISAHRI